MEIFIPITGFDGRYEISNYGRVRTLVPNRQKVTFLKPSTDRLGYLSVCISNLGIVRKNVSLHRLVAIHFIPAVAGKEFVNHKDGNKANNHVDNLEWVTHSENLKHAIRTGLMKVKRGEANPTAKVNTSQVLEIRRLFSVGFSNSDIAFMFNVKRNMVYNITHRYTWKHL